MKQPISTAQQDYPASLDTPAKRSLFDNLGKDAALALRIDTAVRHTKKDGWTDNRNRFKQKEVENAIRTELGERNINVADVLELVKNQREYQ